MFHLFFKKKAKEIEVKKERITPQQIFQDIQTLSNHKFKYVKDFSIHTLSYNFEKDNWEIVISRNYGTYLLKIFFNKEIIAQMDGRDEEIVFMYEGKIKESFYEFYGQKQLWLEEAISQEELWLKEKGAWEYPLTENAKVTKLNDWLILFRELYALEYENIRKTDYSDEGYKFINEDFTIRVLRWDEETYDLEVSVHTPSKNSLFIVDMYGETQQIQFIHQGIWTEHFETLYLFLEKELKKIKEEKQKKLEQLLN